MHSDDFKNWLMKNAGLTAGIAVLLALGIFLMGGDISRRAGFILKIREELALRSQSLESVVSLRSGADRAERISEYMKKLLPAKDQLINFSKDLEKLAKARQLGFGFSFESEIAGSEIEPSTNNFLLSSGGSYPNFLSFLKSVEVGDYFVNFDYFDLNKKDKDFEIIIKGKVFSQ